MEEVREMEEARIRKIGVLSLANLMGIINFFLGLIIGIIFTLTSFLFSSSILGISTSLSIIILPIGYGIVGFITGAIAGFLYNIAAKITKGIKLYSN